MVYAVIWLQASTRGKRGPASNNASSIAFASTAVMIVAPMLWEATIRFQGITPVMAAIALFVFSVAAVVVSWRAEESIAVWISVPPMCATAIVLLVATRRIAPFLVSL